MTLRQSLDIADIRRAMPAVTAVAYLNTGTHGPMPLVAHEAILARQQRDIERGRSGGSRNRTEMMAMKAEIRRNGAGLFNCDADEVAITHGTTYGMNYAIWGLNWRDGDEIVVTNMEHIGGLATAYMLQERLGVVVRFADCTDPARVVDAVRAQLSPRTRIVAFSHVAWSNGYVFPVAEITAAAHAAGALAVVDGAQSAGALPLDVPAIGADAYAAPGQKWLCGPGDTGLLFVSRQALDHLNGSFAAGPSFEQHDGTGNHVQQPNARRFEMGTGYAPAVAGFHASLDWVLNEVDRTWAYARTVELADYARARLPEITGVRVLTPAGTGSGLTAFTFDGWEPMAVVEELYERGVVIRSVRQPPSLRVSTGFYNDHSDIERLLAAQKEIRALTPHPARGAGGE